MSGLTEECPPVDPERAVEHVRECWEMAVGQAARSWPGGSWGIDRHAAELRGLVDVCVAVLGRDACKSIYDEWEARYRGFQMNGGRAKFRTIGRELDGCYRRG